MFQGLSRKDIIAWLCIICIPLSMFLIPVDAQFTPKMRLFLVLTLAAILIFAFEVMHNVIPALLLPICYIYFGLAPAPVALSPYTTDIPWMVVGGFVVAVVLDRTGLLRRIAYWVIIRTGATYRGIIFGLIILGTIPIVSAVPMATLSYGICKALDLGKSRASAGIMMSAAVAVLTRCFYIYSPGNLGILLGTSQKVHPLPMDYGTFLYQNVVFVLLVIIMGFVASIMMKPEKPIEGKSYFIAQREALGPMSLEEKKCAVITTLLMLGLFTTQWTGLSTVLLFVLAPTLMFLPIIGCGKPEDIRNVNYGMMIFVASCMSIGAVATHIGLGKLIASTLTPHLAGLSPTGFIMGTWGFAVLINFLLTPLAAMATFGATLTQTALDLGIDPYVANYAFFQGLDQIIMPYEYALYMIFFSFGLIHIKDFMKFFAVKMFICGLFLFAIGIPYWHLIGLL